MALTREFIAAVVALFTGAAAVIALVRPPLWVSIGVASGPAVLAAGAQVLQTRQRRLEEAANEQRDLAELAAAANALVVLWPLPQVRDADPYDVGVFRSAIAMRYARPGNHPPYVPRKVDQELDAALKGRSFVVVVGPSRAGKSRTAFEAAVRTRGGDLLVVPRSRASLGALADTVLPRQGPSSALLWLENLDEFVGPDGLMVATLRAWQTAVPSVTVLATIRWVDYHRLMFETGGELGRIARDVLDRASSVELSRELDKDEFDEARRLYPQERLVGSLGEHFAAAHELLQRFKSGEEGSPVGYGFVRAAVDWRRVGLDRPVPQADLYELYRVYLEQIRPLHEPDEAELAASFAWATRVEHRAAALLLRDATARDSFRASDYIVEYVERLGKPVPGPAQSLILNRVSPAEALRMGDLAQGRDDVAGARLCWERAVGSGIEGIAAQAAYNLGRLALRHGEVAEAESAFDQAARLHDGTPSFLAAIRLGEIAAGRGDVALAEQRYRLASGAADEDVSMAAANLLGDLLVRLDRGDEAEAVYLSVARSANRGHAPSGAVRLGLYLEQKGRHEDARAWYTQAMASGRPDSASAAGVLLGRLLSRGGDHHHASAILNQTVRLAHPRYAMAARIELARMRARDGDRNAADGLLREVVQRGSVEYATLAQLERARLVADTDSGLAASLLRDVQRSSESRFAAAAALELGHLQSAAGNRADAEATLRAAPLSDTAWLLLAELCLHRDDPTTAAHALAQSVHAAGPAVRPLALARLGLCLLRIGEGTSALRALRAVVPLLHAGARIPARLIDDPDLFTPWTPHDSGPVDLVTVGAALVELGDLTAARAALDAAGTAEARYRSALVLCQHGDVEGAASGLRQVLDEAVPGWSDAAAVALAALHRRTGRVDDAIALLRAVADSGTPVAAEAALNLGALLAARGDQDGAVAAWHQARQATASRVAAAATVNLADRYAGRGDPAEARRLYLDAYRTRIPTVGTRAAAGLAELVGRDPAAAGADAVEVSRALTSLGELTAAQAVLEAATDAPEVRYRLALVLRDRGGADRAAALLRQLLLDGEEREGSAYVTLLLANLEWKRGNVDEAEVLLRAVTGRHAPTAALNLGTILAGRSDLDGAATAWRQAISGSSGVAAAAALNLADLHRRRGEAADACKRYVDAGQSRLPAIRARAAAGLAAVVARDPAAPGDGAIAAGLALAGSGDLVAAQAVLEAAEHGESQYRAALVRYHRGDIEGAIRVLRGVVDTGAAGWAESAAMALATIHWRQGRPDHAVTLLRPLAGSATPAGAEASLNLGAICAGLGDSDGAGDAWRQALRSTASRVAAAAALNLVEMAIINTRSQEGVTVTDMSPLYLEIDAFGTYLTSADEEPRQRPDTQPAPWPADGFDVDTVEDITIRSRNKLVLEASELELRATRVSVDGKGTVDVRGALIRLN